MNRVRYCTVTSLDAVRLSVTGNATAASARSLARASATDKSAGPFTVAVTVSASTRPDSAVTEPADRVTITASCEAGRTEIPQSVTQSFAL